MPVPKRKTSRAVRDSRRGGNNKTTAAEVTECPHCHQPKMPHRVCPSCGYYKGREVVETE